MADSPPILGLTNSASSTPSSDPDEPSAQDRILDATLTVLAREGVAGVKIRAIAREAGVAVGLANYHFENKTTLVGAALERIGERDLELLAPPPDRGPGGTGTATATANTGTDGTTPTDGAADHREHLRHCLRRTLDPEFLDPGYLSLRLQLWSLAGVDPAFAAINRAAQQRYLGGLAGLLAAARPDLSRAEIDSRSADILVTQNGVWLTAILIEDHGAVERALARCESLAFE